MKYVVITLCLLTVAIATSSFHTVKNPAQWICKATFTGSQVIKLRLEATIDKGWFVYSSNNNQEYSPTPASLTFSQSDLYKPLGKLESIGANKKYQSAFGVNTESFRNRGVLEQKVRLLKPTKVVKGVLSYIACTEKEGICTFKEVPFSASLK
jgi:thiol:disulfide interchange protein DsbD